MLSTLRARSSAGAVGLAALLATAPLAAQQEQMTTEFQSWRLPGWSFTPGVILGGLFDSNVAVAFPPADTNRVASDKLFQIQPFGQLEYFSPRTTFSSGYQGSVRRYVDFGELDGTDHHGYFSVRHLVNRRVAVFATDNYQRVATTDQLELNGVPFRRTGARDNSFGGGLEARLTRSIDLATRYDQTWVDFVRKDTPLTGGFVNGIHSSLSRRLDARSSFGGEYGVRWADLNGGLKNLLFQEVGAIYSYRTGPLTTFEAAGGFAHLDDRTHGITKQGPYVRVSLTHHAERATLGLAFDRSYVPSLAFGGTNQSHELRGYVQMPLSRNRFYVNESAAWRRTNPFIDTELPLDSMWIRTVGGYAMQRWLRLEGYHSFTRQDTRVAAGQISRHIVGAQLVISDPMRIR